MNREKPTCKECGEAFSTYGRTDRLFCSDRCRQHYYYNAEKTSRMVHRRVTSKLNQNYELLDGLVRLGVSSIGRMEAVQIGLDLEVMTSCRKSKGHMDCCCFDISYRLTDTKVTNISKCLTTFVPAVGNSAKRDK